LSFPYVLAVALALAMDVLAVSLAVGVSRRGLTGGQVLRMAAAFGLFQAGMTMLGAVAGANVLAYIRSYDHWAAFGLLAVVGMRMGYESFRPPHVPKGDPTRGLALVILAVATSLDALAVGLSLAALETSILYPAAVIGVVSFWVAVAGAKSGPRIGRWAGRWAELAGGAVLIAIGVRILIVHLRG
jgi:putative Mn2+ efflux pump MntP